MDAPNSHDRLRDAIEDNVPALLAYFVRRVDSADDAADLLSDTLLVLWRREDALPTDATEVRMWMFGIARNVLTSHKRTHRRRSALHDRLLSTLIASDGGAAVESEYADVRAALSSLDDTDREIIRLTFWDGFSQAEVARLLSMPEGTVRSRTHRARQQLRQRLRAQHEHGPVAGCG